MIEFIPYGKQSIDEEDIEKVVKVLRSDWITTGPKVQEFETSISKYVGSKFTTVVNSGTSALDLAVQSLNLKAKSEVITTPFSFMATANAIVYNDLVPVFADIQKETRNIDPDQIRAKITKKTKAIIYMDYAGQPCDIKEIREIADEYDLYLIEDACHAMGAEYNGKKVGTFADLTVFSFHPVKHITTGEGGAVTTDHQNLDETLKVLRNHGIDKDLHKRQSQADYMYDMKTLGRNYRLTDIQCALGISQLKKLDYYIEMRNKLVIFYSNKLKDLEFLDTPVVKPHIKHAWHIYTLLLDERVKRDKFFQYMKKNNIGVNVHYIPIYRFTYYINRFNFKIEDFPVTEEVFKRIITLPIHPKLTQNQLEYICTKTKEYFD